MEQAPHAIAPVAPDPAVVSAPWWVESVPKPVRMLLHVALMIVAIPIGIAVAMVAGEAATTAIADGMCTDPGGYCLAILPGLLVGLGVVLGIGAAAAWLTDNVGRRWGLFLGYLGGTFAFVVYGDINSVWHSLGL